MRQLVRFGAKRRLVRHAILHYQRCKTWKNSDPCKTLRVPLEAHQQTDTNCTCVACSTRRNDIAPGRGFSPADCDPASDPGSPLARGRPLRRSRKTRYPIQRRANKKYIAAGGTVPDTRVLRPLGGRQLYGTSDKSAKPGNLSEDEARQSSDWSRGLSVVQASLSLLTPLSVAT